jgi:hypothetical protein
VWESPDDRFAPPGGGAQTGDVDGDGRPEFFTVPKGEAEFVLGGRDGNLLAVRDGGARGEVVWRKGFDGPVGTPLLADLDGDGHSEVIVSVGDGFVYVLGK